MFLAGIPVSSDVVVGLAKLVKDPALAARLVSGVERDVIAIRLDDEERAVVLKALVDAPPGLEDVRASLLDQSRWPAAVAVGDADQPHVPSV